MLVLVLSVFSGLLRGQDLQPPTQGEQAGPEPGQTVDKAAGDGAAQQEQDEFSGQGGVLRVSSAALLPFSALASSRKGVACETCNTLGIRVPNAFALKDTATIAVLRMKGGWEGKARDFHYNLIGIACIRPERLGTRPQYLLSIRSLNATPTCRLWNRATPTIRSSEKLNPLTRIPPC